MGYGLLILMGFMSSFHCVGMCGPLIVGYTTKQASSEHNSYSSHLLYGLGKTLFYTVIGGLFGIFGSFIAFTPYIRGMVGLAAGFFLILFGLHMLNVFPSLDHFQFKTPAFFLRFVGKQVRNSHNPFTIGLLNGLMIICGPLQAMYVMAAGTGSGSQGAALLFFFCLGTLPLMLGFGVLTSVVSLSLTPKLLKASGIVIIVLGCIMFNRGLAITGTGSDFHTLQAKLSNYLLPATKETSTSYEQTQSVSMDVLGSKFIPDQFTLRKGVHVKWVINAKELNECTKGIIVPQYGIKVMLQPGIQTVEFIPKESGVIAWSCWMGMISGTFIVVDNASETGWRGLANQVSAWIESFERRIVIWSKQWSNRLTNP